MFTARRIFLLIGIGFALGLSAALLLAPSSPRLCLTFLGRTEDYWGRPIAHFAVTNLGGMTAISSLFGNVEVIGQTNKVEVTCKPNIHRLSPKQGDVLEVVLPNGFRGTPWRFTCFYGREGLRYRIYEWQWAPGGPGTNANWLIPRPLKGIPLDVKGTSDWIGK